MEDVGVFYGHSVNVPAIEYISWPFGIFCLHFGIFSPFLYVVPRKIWQPWLNRPLHKKLFYFFRKNSATIWIFKTSLFDSCFTSGLRTYVAIHVLLPRFLSLSLSTSPPGKRTDWLAGKLKPVTSAGRVRGACPTTAAFTTTTEALHIVGYSVSSK
jgi:hypothetical protein